MKVDLTRIDLPALGVGFAIWAVALVIVWLTYRQASPMERNGDFQNWKHLHNRPHASFSDFVGSEQAPRIYLSKSDLSLGITAVALLVLYGALRNWGVIS